MDNKQQSYVFTSYSFIDLVSASGGIITGLMALFGPIAALFSKLQFELGVISLLFSAKFMNKTAPTGAKSEETRFARVKISTRQFFRLFLTLYNPALLLAPVLAIFLCCKRG